MTLEDDVAEVLTQLVHKTVHKTIYEILNEFKGGSEVIMQEDLQEVCQAIEEKLCK